MMPHRSRAAETELGGTDGFKVIPVVVGAMAQVSKKFLNRN